MTNEIPEKRHRILVVDDDAGFRKTLSDILEVKGYIPIALAEGNLGLARVKVEKPAAALIDLKLEDMSGLALMKEIKMHSPKTECILLTGHASQASAIEAVNLGAYGYLQKPYEVEQLLVMLRRAIEKGSAEEALRESEERFREVIASISDHIYVTEVLEEGVYVYRYLSPDVEDLTGYPRSKFLADWSFWNSVVIHVDDRNIAVDQVKRLMEGYDSEIEYRLVRADQQVIWVRDSARVRNEGSLKVIYGVVSNITERKQLEEQLRQTQKMEAIGRLAGGVAHDFNNILTVIIGNCDFMLNEVNHNDTLYKDIRQIERAGKRAASLTRQLLAFSRQQVLQMRILNLNTVVADMDKMLRRLIGEDIELSTVLEPDLGNIRADSGQIEQILLNLVVNARDAMPQGGKLTVETANVELDEAYARRHVDIVPGAYILLTVIDTGTGMDMDTQSHIFEPFFTTKEMGKGTGLGLSTIFGIVKQSDGHIYVYSEPGHGTMFKLYFPRINQDTVLDSRTPVTAEPSRGLETVLLVEDEELVRGLAHRALIQGGYHVLQAGHGLEALQVCERYPGPIHILITDVVMPGGMSGHELARKLLLTFPDIKVLYMSGYTDDAIVHHGVLEPSTAFLQKPFTPNTLIRRVREVLDQRN